MTDATHYDLIIVGAGPAGLSASVSAKAYQLNTLTLEKGSLANTLDYYYQYKKYVMAQPAIIPLRSNVPFQAGSREDVLHTWTQLVRRQALNIHYHEPVQAVVRTDTGFTVTTNQHTYTAEKVILAIGKLGNPRRLGVPGEDLPHVSDRLVDPQVHTAQDVVVIGGGDSAAEVALALTDHNRVSIVYRGAEFYRMNDSLRGQILDKLERQELRVYFNAEPERIDTERVHILLPEQGQDIPADWVCVKIGAEIPRRFLERCGVTFPSQDAAALPQISARYESQVPGLFLIGSINGQDLIKHGLNQGYEVIEYLLGHALEPVDEALLREKLQLVAGRSVDEKLSTIANQVPLFADVPKPQLRELFLVSTLHDLSSQAVVFREGDYSTTFFSIVSGSVTVSIAAAPDKGIRLAQGEFFGEMGLLSDRPRSATVTTTEPALLLEIPRRAMLRLINSAPPVKRFIDEVYMLRALRSYLGPQLSHDQFRKVAGSADLVRVKKDEVIFREDEPGDAFYVIRSGSVEISRKNEDGKPYIVAYMHAGQYFGEMALLSADNRRGATVSAAAKTELVRILRQDFLELLAEFPELQEQIQLEMGKRHIESAVILEAPKRVEVLTDFIKLGVVESTDILIIDETKCIRCNNCESACAGTHGGHSRLDRQHGPSFAQIHIPVACRHCEGAPCLQDCPPGDAILRDANGIVQINEETCIGCGNCAAFCPYGVISMVDVAAQPSAWNWFRALPGGSLVQRLLTGKTATQNTSGESGDAHRGIAVKCDLCQGMDGGPACVRSCPTGAAIRVSPDYFQQVESR